MGGWERTVSSVPFASPLGKAIGVMVALPVRMASAFLSNRLEPSLCTRPIRVESPETCRGHWMAVKTSYLQMFVHPERAVPPPREGLVVVHARTPIVPYYRFLQETVGQ